MSSPPLNSLETYLSVPRKREAEALVRKRNASSTVTSSVDEFLSSKVEDISLDIEYAHTLLKGIQESFDDKLIPENILQDAKQSIQYNEARGERELVVLKRQRKIVKEDMEDLTPSFSTLEDAYTSVIVSKTLAAQANKKKGEIFDQCGFRASVIEYYNAGRRVAVKDNEPYDEVFCHLTGWQDAKNIKAARIVPKSLKGDELSYLFGVGEVILSDPRNGLTLDPTIEKALDSGLIVLVPTAPHSLENVQWKCVVTDKTVAKRTIIPGITWKDLDGRKLQFLGPHRPAKRFLYFRFVITYLECKQNGQMSWVDDVEAKGTMWPTPGPYLRRSMLVSLARKISDRFLPEVFYDKTTFETAEGSAARPLEEEDAMALSLKSRLSSRGLEDEEGNDSDDGTEE
ncbi:MAG: hypothetical protein Q9201_007003 [Fulgogasparrea decipioides]